jgi:predicted DNA-binding protein (MmcQ/YjbR family)
MPSEEIEMDIEAIRDYCLSLPATTEDIQWGNDLLFRVAKKFYAGIELNPAVRHQLFFKCEPDTFAELVERDGVMPASYIGRYHWVAVRLDALTVEELKKLIATSYELILKKLPTKLKLRLIGEASARTAKGHRKSAARVPAAGFAKRLRH